MQRQVSQRIVNTTPRKPRIVFPLAGLMVAVGVVSVVQLRTARVEDMSMEATPPVSEAHALPPIKDFTTPQDTPPKSGVAPRQIRRDHGTGALGGADSEESEIVDLGPRIRPENPVTWSGDTTVVDLGERIRPEDKPIDSGYATPIDMGPRISADSRISFTPSDDEIIEIGEPMEVPNGTFLQATEGASVELGPYIPIDPSPINR